MNVNGSFKTYISESNNLLLEYTQHNISELISIGALPLDPGMMDRLGFTDNISAFHLTNKKHLKDMYKNQNKKKQISTFTVGGPELLRLPSQPDVLLTLKGTSVLSGETDLWSLVSTRDRKWLDHKHKVPGNKLYFLIQGVIAKIAKKYGLGDTYNMKDKDIQAGIEKLNKKEQVQLYREYLKGIEQLLNSHYLELIDYTKNAAKMKYNEVILTKWVITKVQCIDIDQDTVINFCKETGIKYGGLIMSKDLASLKI